MGAWIRHAGTYVLVNAFLIVIWLVTAGSVEELEAIGDDPATNLSAAFWPIWPILGWGLAVSLHLLSVLTGGGRRRRRAQRSDPGPEPQHRLGEAREALEAGEGVNVPAMPDRPVDRVSPAPPSPPVPPTAGKTSPNRIDRGGQTTRFVTLLFSDLVGSTSLNETLGDAAYATVLTQHRTSVRRIVERHGGREVGTQGDGFLVRFASPVEAVTAACEIQRAAEADRSGGSFAPDVRIGLHAGDAVEADGDVVGTVVNVASRVCGTAEAGQIYVTEPVAERVTGRISLVDKGLVPLKGITSPRHLFEIDWDDRYVFESDQSL